MEDKKKTLPSYLQHNDWQQELNFKVWVTKGARFCADKRLQREGGLSQIALNFLSAYLIIVGLFPLYLKSFSHEASQVYISLATTSISIVLLVFGLIESSKQHALKAHMFHECALKISRIYNRLRRAKRLADGPDKEEAFDKITEEYNEILEVYENHETIDYDVFKLQKTEYFELTKLDIVFIKFRYYFQVQFIYHVIILLPPLLVAILFWAQN